MNHPYFKRALPLALLVWCAAIVDARSGKDYHPVIDPSKFTTTVDNPYFPLVPGTTYQYVEKSGKDVAETKMTVTHDTKEIMGVSCVVVHILVTEKGKLDEETYDWYAQDRAGNVWYFGEDTREMHNGKFDPEGSWEAGVGKNQPGIIMPANPAPGEPYYQEYSPGNAEDMGQIVAVHETVSVTFGTFKDCVRAKEWSLLAAGSEKKWYARGVGCIKEVSPEGDVNELVAMKKAE